MHTSRNDILNALESTGFAYWSQLSPSCSTYEVASDLGKPISLGEGSPVHLLRPLTKDEAAPNSYSSNYELGVFPLHTDFANWYLPPRYLLLRCLVGFEDVKTTIMDARPILREVGTSSLSRALMKPRRQVAGAVSLLPLLQAVSGVPLLRWDEKYLTPASKAGQECVAQIAQIEKELPREHISLIQKGDAVLIDNWQVFHGRGCVSELSRSRLIERVYISELAI